MSVSQPGTTSVEPPSAALHLYCRPNGEAEEQNVVVVSDTKLKIILPKQKENGGYSKSHHTKHQFNLARVFGSSTPVSMMSRELEPLVEAAMRGSPLCLLVYGPLRSGKTAILQGGKNEGSAEGGVTANQHQGQLDGLHISVAQQLLQEAPSTPGVTLKYFVSALYIVNNQVCDALTTSTEDNGTNGNGAVTNFKASSGPDVQALSQLELTSVEVRGLEDVEDLLEEVYQTTDGTEATLKAVIFEVAAFRPAPRLPNQHQLQQDEEMTQLWSSKVSLVELGLDPGDGREMLSVAGSRDSKPKDTLASDFQHLVLAMSRGASQGLPEVSPSPLHRERKRWVSWLANELMGDCTSNLNTTDPHPEGSNHSGGKNTGEYNGSEVESEPQPSSPLTRQIAAIVTCGEDPVQSYAAVYSAAHTRHLHFLDLQANTVNRLRAKVKRVSAKQEEKWKEAKTLDAMPQDRAARISQNMQREARLSATSISQDLQKEELAERSPRLSTQNTAEHKNKRLSVASGSQSPFASPRPAVDPHTLQEYRPVRSEKDRMSMSAVRGTVSMDLVIPSPTISPRPMMPTDHQHPGKEVTKPMVAGKQLDFDDSRDNGKMSTSNDAETEGVSNRSRTRAAKEGTSQGAADEAPSDTNLTATKSNTSAEQTMIVSPTQGLRDKVASPGTTGSVASAQSRVDIGFRGIDIKKEQQSSSRKGSTGRTGGGGASSVVSPVSKLKFLDQDPAWTALSSFDVDAYQSHSAMQAAANQALAVVLQNLDTETPGKGAVLQDLQSVVFPFLHRLQPHGVLEATLTSVVYILYIQAARAGPSRSLPLRPEPLPLAHFLLASQEPKQTQGNRAPGVLVVHLPAPPPRTLGDAQLEKSDSSGIGRKKLPAKAPEPKQSSTSCFSACFGPKASDPSPSEPSPQDQPAPSSVPSSSTSPPLARQPSGAETLLLLKNEAECCAVGNYPLAASLASLHAAEVDDQLRRWIQQHFPFTRSPSTRGLGLTAKMQQQQQQQQPSSSTSLIDYQAAEAIVQGWLEGLNHKIMGEEPPQESEAHAPSAQEGGSERGRECSWREGLGSIVGKCAFEVVLGSYAWQAFSKRLDRLNTQVESNVVGNSSSELLVLQRSCAQMQDELLKDERITMECRERGRAALTQTGSRIDSLLVTRGSHEMDFNAAIMDMNLDVSMVVESELLLRNAKTSEQADELRLRIESLTDQIEAARRSDNDHEDPQNPPPRKIQTEEKQGEPIQKIQNIDDVNGSGGGGDRVPVVNGLVPATIPLALPPASPPALPPTLTTATHPTLLPATSGPQDSTGRFSYPSSTSTLPETVASSTPPASTRPSFVPTLDLSSPIFTQPFQDPDHQAERPVQATLLGAPRNTSLAAPASTPHLTGASFESTMRRGSNSNEQSMHSVPNYTAATMNSKAKDYSPSPLNYSPLRLGADSRSSTNQEDQASPGRSSVGTERLTATPGGGKSRSRKWVSIVLPASGAPPIHLECSRHSSGMISVRAKNRRDPNAILNGCPLPSMQVIESIVDMEGMHEALGDLPSEMYNQVVHTSKSLDGMMLRYRKMFNLINSKLPT